VHRLRHQPLGRELADIGRLHLVLGDTKERAEFVSDVEVAEESKALDMMAPFRLWKLASDKVLLGPLADRNNMQEK